MISNQENLTTSDKIFLKLVQKDIGSILTSLESKADWVDLFCMSFNVNLTATNLCLTDSVQLFRTIHLNLRPVQASLNGKRSSASRNQEEIFDLYQEIYNSFCETYDLHLFFLELTDGTFTCDDKREQLTRDVLEIINRADNDLRMLRRDRVRDHFLQIAHMLRTFRDS